MAAALYVLPSAVLGVIARQSLWPWPLLVIAVSVLVVYAHRTGSALVVLGLAVLLGVTEFAAGFGSALGERCGDSQAAGDVEAAGAAVLLLVVGAVGVKRRRLWLLPLAVVGAAVWAVVVAHVIPGGAGGCFE